MPILPHRELVNGGRPLTAAVSTILAYVVTTGERAGKRAGNGASESGHRKSEKGFGVSPAMEPISLRHTAGPEHPSQEPLLRETAMVLGQGCPSAWDSFTCWPPTEAGRALRKPCAHIIASLDISLAESDASLAKGLYAYRVCGDDGNWLWGNWTNYTECLGLINQQSGQQSSSAVSLAVVYILLLFSLLSLIFLSASMFIFCYFRSLECPRTRVHRNLMLALAVHAIMLVVLSTPLALHPDAPTPFAQTPVLCKCVLSLKMYAATASINWMFVEGLLLHSRVAVSVFRQDAPFRLYYALGWGLPLVFILAWAYVTEKQLRTACWEGYGSSPNVWILIAPRLVAILVNSVFLVNIVRILVTRIKPKASALETTQFRKAIKATALLFPLLGITHLLFCINPQNETMGLKEAYMIINAVLQSSQQFHLTREYFVSVPLLLHGFRGPDSTAQRLLAGCGAAGATEGQQVSVLDSARQSTVQAQGFHGVFTLVGVEKDAAHRGAGSFETRTAVATDSAATCPVFPATCRRAVKLGDSGRSRTIDIFHV
ncbi:hypothetical protein MRX96_042470 [Rhipicephalus microplus]